MAKFTLYGSGASPNPWKSVMVLKELGLDYETKMLDFTSNFDTGEHKQPAYLKVNPNGRVPALVDHGSNDFTVWESCAMYVTSRRSMTPSTASLSPKAPRSMQRCCNGSSSRLVDRDRCGAKPAGL